MGIPSRSLRWLQIGLTLFYGQVISTGIYEYLIQGLCGLALSLRPKYDSILLIILSLFMFAFVVYGLLAIWYCRIRMSMITVLILTAILILTLVKSIIEIVYMGRGSMRVQWLTIRMVELVWRFIGIILHVGFIIRLKQGYEPENLI